MTVDELRARLQDRREALRSMGVRSLRVFGSVARGEAGAESDVDLLVDLDPKRRISLLDFAHILGELEEMLGRRVDLVEPHCLRPEIRDEVLAEAVDAA